MYEDCLEDFKSCLCWCSTLSVLAPLLASSDRCGSFLDIGRNEEFLRSCELYAEGIFAAAAVIDQIPVWLRPLLGPLVAAPNKRHINVAIKHAKPIIEDRLRHVELKMKDQNYAWEAPVSD